MNETGHDMDSLEPWLRAIGLEKYLELFRENEIDLDILPEVEEADLKELGVPLGDRKRLLKAVALLGAETQAEEKQLAMRPQDVAVPAVRQAERRQLTVLFCDMVGSTGLSARFDPEDTSAMIQEYQRVCSDLVKQWGGFVSQYLGDGIMAYFGWPIGHEKDAERAVRAGFAMTQATAKLRAPDGTALAARVGIASGLVMVGEIIGEESSKQETAIGATPNVAAKLQSIARPNGVAICDDTRLRLPQTFDLADLGLSSFSGLEQEVRAWSINSLTAKAVGIWGGTTTDAIKLVGRSKELRILGDAWATAKDGKGSAMQIVADAGVGKSKFVTSFFEDIDLDPQYLIRLYGSSFHTVTAFFPVLEELRRLFGFAPTDSGQQSYEKIKTTLHAAGLDTQTEAGLLAMLLEVKADLSVDLTSLSPQLRRTQTINAVVSVLLKLRKGNPVLLLVEDVHWFDPSTMEVIKQAIASVATGLPVLVLLTLRPEIAVREWSAESGIRKIQLEPLRDEQIHKLILQHTGGISLPVEATTAILANTDGVPLFIQELTRAIIESGQLELRGNTYILRNADLQLDVPSTIQASLAARLDRRPSAKPIAQAAATIGRVFTPGLLAYITGTERTELEVHLAELVNFGVLLRAQDAAGDRYQFVHALVQETAYQSQLRDQRRNVHLKVAHALHDKFSDDTENRPEILARHFAQAGKSEEAANYYLEAGRQAISNSAVQEAISQLKKGLALIQPLPPSPVRDIIEMRIQASIGTALMLSKGWAAAEVQHTYMHAASLTNATDNVTERLWIMWGAWVSRHVHGRVQSATTISKSIRQVADAANVRSGLLIADMVETQTSFYTGKFAQSVGFGDAMREKFRPHKDRGLVNLYSTDLEIVVLVHQMLAYWALGQNDRALALLDQVDETAHRLDHFYTLSWFLVWGATLPILMRDFDRARAMVLEGRTIAENHGYDYVISLSQIQMGFIDFQTIGDPENAVKMREGVLAFQSTGAEIVVPHLKTMIASVEIRMGRGNAALDLLSEAEAQITAHGENWQLSGVHWVRAQALQQVSGAKTGDIMSAYTAALDAARKQGATGLLLRAGLSFDKYLREAGQVEKANEMMQRIVDECGPEVNSSDLEKAKENVSLLVK
jgi:class 3 adenylate cyclase